MTKLLREYEDGGRRKHVMLLTGNRLRTQGLFAFSPLEVVVPTCHAWKLKKKKKRVVNSLPAGRLGVTAIG
jgi:hypothetical protein